MSYKTMIPGCFGVADYKFALHPADSTRAIKMLQECVDSDVPLKDLLSEVRTFLQNAGSTNQHIDTQLEHVAECFRGWLSD